MQVAIGHAFGGAGLVAFTGARLRPGAEMVMESLRLDERLDGAQVLQTTPNRVYNSQRLTGALTLTF